MLFLKKKLFHKKADTKWKFVDEGLHEVESLVPRSRHKSYKEETQQKGAQTHSSLGPGHASQLQTHQTTSTQNVAPPNSPDYRAQSTYIPALNVLPRTQSTPWLVAPDAETSGLRNPLYRPPTPRPTSGPIPSVSGAAHPQTSDGNQPRATNPFQLAALARRGASTPVSNAAVRAAAIATASSRKQLPSPTWSKERMFHVTQRHTCVICTEDYPHDDFLLPTSSCAHEADYCRACMQQVITTELNSKGWDKIRCPGVNCKQLLSDADVLRHAPRKVYDR